MKKGMIILKITLLILNCMNTQAKGENDEKVEKIKRFNYLYRYQNFYLGGQPTLEELHWLKAQGVSRIINLRTEKENNEYSSSAFNEQSLVKELGFEYFEIPVGSTKDYSPGKLKAVSNRIKEGEKILLHCRTAGRVTQFFMAYLVKYQGYTINEAIAIGKNMNFSFPLEQLLDVEISMEKK